MSSPVRIQLPMAEHKPTSIFRYFPLASFETPTPYVSIPSKGSRDFTRASRDIRVRRPFTHPYHYAI